MKYYCYLMISFLLPLFAKGQGILKSELIKNESVPLRKITEYEYEMPVSDSLKINGTFEENLPVEHVEVFDRNNNLIREELYREGKISSAYDYYYENGKLAYSLGDTLFQNYVTRRQYKYLPNHAYQVETTLPDQKSTPEYIIQEDEQGRVIGEYILKNGKDTSSFFHYAYDPVGRTVAMVRQFHKNEKKLSDLFIYNPKGDKIKQVTYDVTGKLIREDLYSYPGKNICKIIHIDHEKNTTQYTTKISYLDQHGNIYKRYLNTQYKPQVWIVQNYRIEYAKQ